ncbi:MAG TPA: pyruvate dehydrogenase complex dihydrolipoamide acetyltransferase, partial [Chloroflexota bacterium]|nr:pyruvate dehydrogenase complex dihydrolipoamide acetyltransferase [Chloroflexota bacterium]
MGGRDEREAEAAAVGGGRRRQTRRAAVLSAAGGAAAVGLLGACAPGEAPAGGAQGGRPALSG